jgi:hypothetical protein
VLAEIRLLANSLSIQRTSAKVGRGRTPTVVFFAAGLRSSGKVRPIHAALLDLLGPLSAVAMGEQSSRLGVRDPMSLAPAVVADAYAV